MKSLILSHSNSFKDPRPARIINLLEKRSLLTIIGIFDSHPYHTVIPIKRSYIKKFFMRGMQIFCPLILARILNIFFTDIRVKLNQSSFDLIVCHDLILLPLALSLKSSHTRVIFDAREFYPLEFESSFVWKLTFQRFYTALCKRYLSLCDGVMTVSPGLQKLYRAYFQIETKLIYSLPTHHALTPHPVSENQIKLIYHGAANPDRRLEELIDMMKFLDKKFHLTLILVPGNKVYIEELRKRSQGLSVSIKPPYPFDRIISETNKYDIGLCCFPPSTTNLQFCMPNKLFEYIQARLMIFATPLHDLLCFVKREKLGVISDGFSAELMAKSLRDLTKSDIESYKKIVHQKAIKFTYENQENLLFSFLTGK